MRKPKLWTCYAVYKNPTMRISVSLRMAERKKRRKMVISRMSYSTWISVSEWQRHARSKADGKCAENISEEDLLGYLSPEQRKAFEDILKDPEKARQLLDMDNEQDESDSYWWQQSLLDGDGNGIGKGKGKARPIPLDRSLLLPVPFKTELALEHNLLAIV
jgi:hypothetical protein